MRWRPIFPTERSDCPSMERLVFLESRPLGVYLHRFSPKAEIQGHDHPWDFLTVVLSGGYSEARKGAASYRTARSVSFRKASSVHSLRVGRRGCLTLCVRGPHRREWSWAGVSR